MTRRCADCLREFGDQPRFAVIKEDDSRRWSDEERSLGGHHYEASVCSDCVGWYQGNHLEVSRDDMESL